MRRDRKPSRLALPNWPIRWKVFAIVVVPLALAGVFGGAGIYASMTEAAQLGGAAERTDMVPAVVDYVAALEGTMVAATEGVDAQPALTTFDSRRIDLQRELADTEVPDSVRTATSTLLEEGQDLLGRVMGNAGDLRTRMMAYVPVLNTAATAIAGLVADSPGIRSVCDALTGAVGVRGQMVMQQLLVARGGDLPEAALRSALLALAGAEPSLVSAIDAYLGAESDRATVLRSEMDNRMRVLSDPESVLVGNPELLASQQITRDIVAALISETSNSILATVDQQAHDARSAAIRDATFVAAAIAIALLLVLVVARSLVHPAEQARRQLQATDTRSRHNRSRAAGPNLMGLAGAEIPRGQGAAVAVTVVVDAAIAGVQDSTRVAIEALPGSEVTHPVAGDLAHLLTELLDNALRHSPPTVRVNVSAVQTANGGLVLEVADSGLGMTESDLRFANTRLQSGGAGDPQGGGHAGLVVVSRLSARHGLVVRLRSTVTGEPGSGITAGVYVPAELLVAAGPGMDHRETRRIDSE